MPDPVRVTLEPLAVAHAALLFDGLRDPRVHAFTDEEPPTSLGALEARYAQLVAGAPAGVDETWCNGVIRWAEAPDPVGTVQATIPADGSPTSIAYVLLPHVWGRGVASAAVELLLDELRTSHEVDVVQAEIHADNARSIRLATRLGFDHVDTVERGGAVELVFQKPLGRLPRPDPGAQERFIGEVLGLLIQADEHLPAGALDDAHHLVDHGEPGLGLESVAWAVHNEGASVPSWVMHRVAELGDGLLQPEDLPPGFPLTRS